MNTTKSSYNAPSGVQYEVEGAFPPEFPLNSGENGQKRSDLEIEQEQKLILTQIEEMKDRIRELEQQKTPKARTLKFVLQAR